MTYGGGKEGDVDGKEGDVDGIRFARRRIEAMMCEADLM